MHDHAEHGVAAHWAYKEAGSQRLRGVSASSEYDAKIAVLRQLLAWERDLSGTRKGCSTTASTCSRPTPPSWSCPGRHPGGLCLHGAHQPGPPLPGRAGRRRHGAAQHPLQNGQTVEIIAAKEGGPSRDWLNAELGYLVSHRAKSKVRAWFNALAAEDNVAAGAKRWKSCCSARARPRSSWTIWRSPWAVVGAGAVRAGGQGRAVAAHHRAACCARPSPCPRGRAVVKKRPQARGQSRPRAACWWWGSIR
jgi:hypothetical protein